MPDTHRKHVALWVSVGGIMALVVTLWAMLLPMQLKDGTLIGAREISQWQVYRPKDEDASKTWQETMDKWRTLVNEVNARNSAPETVPAARISDEDILKLKAKIEAASGRNEAAPQPTP